MFFYVFAERCQTYKHSHCLQWWCQCVVYEALQTHGKRFGVSSVTEWCVFPKTHDWCFFEVCYRLVTANSSPHSVQSPQHSCWYVRGINHCCGPKRQGDGVRGQRSQCSIEVKAKWHLVTANDANLISEQIFKICIFLSCHFLLVGNIAVFDIQVLTLLSAWQMITVLFIFSCKRELSLVLAIFSCTLVSVAHSKFR